MEKKKTYAKLLWVETLFTPPRNVLENFTTFNCMKLIAYWWYFENTTIKCLNNFSWKFLGNFSAKTGSGMCQCQSVVPVVKSVQNGEVVGASFDVWRFAQEHDQSAARFSLLPRPAINPSRMWHILQFTARLYLCVKILSQIRSECLKFHPHNRNTQGEVSEFSRRLRSRSSL